eukprot:5089801-Prymnesium_polylepis.1
MGAQQQQQRMRYKHSFVYSQMCCEALDSRFRARTACAVVRNGRAVQGGSVPGNLLVGGPARMKRTTAAALCPAGGLSLIHI